LTTIKFKYLQLILKSFNKNENSTKNYKNIVTVNNTCELLIDSEITIQLYTVI